MLLKMAPTLMKSLYSERITAGLSSSPSSTQTYGRCISRLRPPFGQQKRWALGQWDGKRQSDHWGPTSSFLAGLLASVVQRLELIASNIRCQHQRRVLFIGSAKQAISIGCFSKAVLGAKLCPVVLLWLQRNPFSDCSDSWSDSSCVLCN